MYAFKNSSSQERVDNPVATYLFFVTPEDAFHSETLEPDPTMCFNPWLGSSNILKYVLNSS